MKIAFLSNKDPSIPEIDSDGGAVTPRYYAFELGRRGHEIDIYTPKILTKSINNAYLKDKCNAQRDNKYCFDESVKVIRLPIEAINRGKLTRKTKDLAGIVESFLFADAFEEGQLDGYDIITFFHPLTAYGLVIRGAADLKRSVLFPMLLSDHYIKYQSLSSTYCEMEQLLLTNVGHICSPSQHEKNVLSEKGIPEEKVNVVHRGFDDAIFYPKIRYLNNKAKKGKVVIACTNAIRPQKGQHYLAYASILMKKLGFEPKVVIVGENKRFYKPEHEKYYENLKSLVEKLHLQNNFDFVGAVTSNVVADILRGADLAVFPSESESFGKSVLESIAVGTPTIVCDDIPEYREFIEPNVNALVIDRKPEKFTNAINLLMSNENLYYGLSEKGVKSTREFTWEVVTQKLEDMYLNIILERGKIKCT